MCADAAHAWILPHLPYHEKYGSTEGIAVAAGTGGLSHVMLLSAMDRRLMSGPVPQFIGVGCLAECVGGALFSYLRPAEMELRNLVSA